MSDDKAEAAIRRAEAARALLDPDGLLMEALAAIRAEITEAWRTSPVRDAEGREHLYALACATDQIESMLRSYVEDGTVARHMLAERERDRAVSGAVAGMLG